MTGFGTGPIGTLGAVDSLTVGGRVYTDLSNLIILSAPVVSGGQSSTFRKGNGPAGYQVTAGKTLILSSIVYYSATASANVNILGYGDNDVGYNAAGEPTTPVRYGIGASNSEYWLPLDSTVAQVKLIFDIDFRVPAAKYPYLYNNGNHTSAAFIYGYEV